MATPPDDIWSRLEQVRRLPRPPIPPHLRMTADQIRAEIAKMTPEERDHADAMVEEIYRNLRRERRDPETIGAIFSLAVGLGCVIACPFVGDSDDPAYLTIGVLLAITIISWAIATRLRYRRR